MTSEGDAGSGTAGRATSTGGAIRTALDEDEVRRLPDRWLPQLDALRRFGDAWVPAWNRHDLDALTELVTEDVVWDDPAMHGQTVHGRGEFRAFTELFFTAFPDVRVEAVGSPYLAVDGASFAVRSRLSGTFAGELRIWTKEAKAEAATVPPTGNRFEIPAVDVYELRDGLVARWSLVYDLVGFSRQLGLVP